MTVYAKMCNAERNIRNENDPVSNDDDNDSDEHDPIHQQFLSSLLLKL